MMGGMTTTTKIGAMGGTKEKTMNWSASQKKRRDLKMDREDAQRVE